VVQIIGKDGPGNHPATWINTPEYSAAYDVAANAFASAKNKKLQGQSQYESGGVGPGKTGLPDQGVASAVSGHVLEKFTLFNAWQSNAGVPVNVILDDPTHVWTITATLQAFGDARFQITGLHTASKDFSWNDFSKTNWYAASPAAFEANKTKVEARMTESLRKQFQELRHTLITTDQFTLVAKRHIRDCDRKAGHRATHLCGVRDE